MLSLLIIVAVSWPSAHAASTLRAKSVAICIAGMAVTSFIAYRLLRAANRISKKPAISKNNQEFKQLFASVIKKAHELVCEHAGNKTLPIPVIAIAGCSAVGKTYFTTQLMQALKDDGIRVATLQFDSFMQLERVKDWLIHPNFNHLQAHEIIAQVIRGCEKLTKPTWDLSGPEPVKTVETVSFKDIDLLLFEGVYTLCDADTYDFLKYSTLRIFMDAADADMIEWNWNRKRGITETSKELFAQDVAVGMKKYRTQVGERVCKSANYIVMQDKNHGYALEEQVMPIHTPGGIVWPVLSAGLTGGHMELGGGIDAQI